MPRLKTQENEAFSQTTFDTDLKMLSEEFDKVDPKIAVSEEDIIINIHVWPKPVIRSITWVGNSKFKTSKLQKELDIKPNTLYTQQSFINALNKVKELYIKKGYFESEITFSKEPIDDEINITIHVVEGKAGHVAGFIWKGFTKEEIKDITSNLYTTKYNPLISWLTGAGIFREDALEQDQMTVLSHLQNKGYADASIDVNIVESKQNDRIFIEFNSHRGTLYRFGNIAIEGNKILPIEEINKHILISENDTFSPEKVRDIAQSIRDYYGSKGYIDADVLYDIHLKENEPVYDVAYHIDEGERYSIGLVKVFGNEQTQTNVILRESLIIPGEVFDSRRVKATQSRLENVGYFKNVNVYSVRSPEDLPLPQPEKKRDVNIEVEETTTGNISLFLGMSTLENVSGGLEITERNFNHKGLFTLFSKHPAGLKGGGEYAHANINIGAKQDNYLISWLNPYLMDSLWRVGFDASLTRSKLISSDYKTTTYGFSVSAAYPLTNYWTYITRYRLRDTRTDVNADAGPEAVEQEEHNGLLSAISASLNYDSTDSAYKARRGLRSIAEVEFVGLGGDFTFFKMGYLNSFYQPLWKKATLKLKAEFKFTEPVWKTSTTTMPLSERYFLGGENTVRGYKSFILGPRFENQKDPTGGISSALLSVECSQELHKLIDVFAFVDAGSISEKHFSIPKLNASYGFGTRLEIMSRIPIMLGMGFPINPDNHKDIKKFFFSMGGQF